MNIIGVDVPGKITLNCWTRYCAVPVVGNDILDNPPELNGAITVELGVLLNDTVTVFAI